MTVTHRVRSLLLLGAISAGLIAAASALPSRVRADQPEEKLRPVKPDRSDDAEKGEAADQDLKKDEKKDEPAAPQTAKIAPEAKALLDQADAAYAKLKSLELAGTYSKDIDAVGEEQKDTRNFTAAFVAPNKFRHAMENDVVLGSTGEKAYTYFHRRNLYSLSTISKEKSEIEKLPEPMPQTLQMQNPSLMFAVAKSAAAVLSENAIEIAKADDVQLDGASFPALRLTMPNAMVVTMLFHPESHLLRQVRTDLKPYLEKGGTPDVKNAQLILDYTTVKPDAAVRDDQFAWAPPETARDVAEIKDAVAVRGVDDDGTAEAKALEGKPAPDFKVKDLAGKQVALKDLRGQVVVLDLWATWCGPCRASLPHLDKLYESVKDKGVKVYAVNDKEDKEDVEEFIRTTGLKSPVLLDAEGAISAAYKSPGIPQTIVIGRDGKVIKVLIGFNPEEPDKELKQAVERAMK